MQEAILSERATFLVGDTKASGWQLHTILGIFEDVADIDRPWSGPYVQPGIHIGVFEASGIMSYLMTYWSEWDHIKQVRQSLLGTLSSLRLWSFSGCMQATDLRDTVYGMLGMATHQERDKILVDYDLPTHMVFTLTARALVLHWNNLEILATCEGIRGASQKLDGLASWAPDWTSKMETRHHEPCDQISELPNKLADYVLAPPAMFPFHQIVARGLVLHEVGYNLPGTWELLKACYYTVWSEPAAYANERYKLEENMRGCQPTHNNETCQFPRRLMDAYLRSFLSMRIAHSDLIEHFSESPTETVDTYVNTVLQIYEHRAQACLERSDVLQQAEQDAALTRAREWLSHDKRKELCDHGIGPGEPCRDAECHLNWLRFALDAATNFSIPIINTFFFTTDDRVVLTFAKVRPGDVVALLNGYRWPVILERQASGTFKYVTTCYCEGAKEGVWQHEGVSDMILE